MIQNTHENRMSMAACLCGAWHDMTFTQAKQYMETATDTGRFLMLAHYALEHLPYLRQAEINAMLDAEIGINEEAGTRLEDILSRTVIPAGRQSAEHRIGSIERSRAFWKTFGAPHG